MRSASQWDTWLAEYDQAATEAETYRVAELSQLNVITKDFLAAVNKVAPIWSTKQWSICSWHEPEGDDETLPRTYDDILSP
ncbi:hypothetical protein K505DRAFT_308848 [Melanomma pulvis-pyrius CBS 109.77]|uniref:Uncharacterized protein n=1 Tax=Melanomma pulvis-pyrius CBS 109.77 TaxID=1314802 RepID=A0A6A6X5J4_9PLEO|nr:hypothetical protein K505DRAFT_308848 [Melanomma pulvis-pyrius CBS 109.77]